MESLVVLICQVGTIVPMAVVLFRVFSSLPQRQNKESLIADSVHILRAKPLVFFLLWGLLGFPDLPKMHN